MIHEQIVGIPVHQAVNAIRNYILEMKGVVVDIQLPILPKDEEKFIKAFNIACVYFGITI